MKQAYLCLDIGGTFTKYAFFSKSQEWLKKGRFSTSVLSIDAFFAPIIELIEKNQDLYDILAISLSFPGFIDPYTGIAEQAGAILPLHGHNICQELTQRLSITCPIYIENDANCAALAEKSSGETCGLHSFVLITLGTGVGGAIVTKNQVIEGAHFRGGEFGMMVVDFKNHGYTTLHDLASTKALIDSYREKKEIPLATVLSGEMIFEQEDATSQMIIHEWADYVALLIFNLTVSFDPQKILLGGGVSQNEKLLPLIEQSLSKNPHWKDFEVPIATCFYHNDAGLIGAFETIKQRKGEMK